MDEKQSQCVWKISCMCVSYSIPIYFFFFVSFTFLTHLGNKVVRVNRKYIDFWLRINIGGNVKTFPVPKV